MKLPIGLKLHRDGQSFEVVKGNYPFEVAHVATGQVLQLGYNHATNMYHIEADLGGGRKFYLWRAELVRQMAATFNLTPVAVGTRLKNNVGWEFEVREYDAEKDSYTVRFPDGNVFPLSGADIRQMAARTDEAPASQVWLAEEGSMKKYVIQLTTHVQPGRYFAEVDPGGLFCWSREAKDAFLFDSAAHAHGCASMLGLDADEYTAVPHE